MVHIRHPWVFQDLVDELDRMTRDMGWAFDSAARLPGSADSGLQVSEDEATLQLDLPGVNAEDLDISLEDGLLKILARRSDPVQEGEEVLLRERNFGEFTQAFRLPWRVREEDVQASLKQGVLRLTLKRSPEAAPRRIEVRS